MVVEKSQSSASSSCVLALQKKKTQTQPNSVALFKGD